MGDQDQRKRKGTQSDDSKPGSSAAKRFKSEPQSVSLHKTWSYEEVLADKFDIEPKTAINIMGLLNEDNTIPFISRYRKELTNDMTPNVLREFQDSYEELKTVSTKAEAAIKKLEKTNLLTPDIQSALVNSTSLEQVEDVIAPFKENRKTKAEKARQLGLGEAAEKFLANESNEVDLRSMVKHDVKGLESVDKIKEGISNIIAEKIAREDVIDEMRRLLKERNRIRIESSLSKKATMDDKFKTYVNFNQSVAYLKSHQVLAINRGENLKVLSVKVVLPEYFKHQLRRVFDTKWSVNTSCSFLRKELMSRAFEDAFSRLIEPKMTREVRSHMTKSAENEAIRTFSTNLKDLLVTRPVTGQTIMGIDPGFSHGCKIAAVGPNGDVLETAIIYPHTSKGGSAEEAKRKCVELVKRNKVDVVAIGNGTACRETELFINNLIANKRFSPSSVCFCTVRECGSSTYSVSPQGEEDLPDLIPNLRSAVTIARRVQDPLTEYVRIEPKHIGVGMYQHDLSTKQLEKAVDSVTVDCVSFVGVDVNSCPNFILRKVAGLTDAKAKKIQEWKIKNGNFVNREQLRSVTGIGPKTYQQCAGFVRIVPPDASGSSSTEDGATCSVAKKSAGQTAKSFNPLDMTTIHPESYDVAIRFIKDIGGKVPDIGKQILIDKVNETVQQSGIQNLASKYGLGEPSMQIITDALRRSLEYDFRKEFALPFFKSEMQSFANVTIGAVLTGCVMSIPTFGAFIDVGMEKSGLLHNSKIPRSLSGTLTVGARVEVAVESMDVAAKKLGLRLLRLL